MEAQPTPTARRKKPNSPKAPGLPLRAAVVEVSKIYQRYSHGSFSRGEMAAALGMSSGSGAFLGKAATLKEYGLIDEAGGSASVSELFKAIYQAPVGSAELRRHALQAVRTPSLFARLLQQSGSKVLDQEALALRLETQERFNRERAAAVAAAFRASLADYGLIDGRGNVLPVRDDEQPAGRDEPNAADDDDEGDDALSGAPRGAKTFRVEVPLGEGRRAVLALPEDLAQADTARICAVLAAYTQA